MQTLYEGGTSAISYSDKGNSFTNMFVSVCGCIASKIKMKRISTIASEDYVVVIRHYAPNGEGLVIFRRLFCQRWQFKAVTQTRWDGQRENMGCAESKTLQSPHREQAEEAPNYSSPILRTNFPISKFFVS